MLLADLFAVVVCVVSNGGVTMSNQHKGVSVVSVKILTYFAKQPLSSLELSVELRSD